MTPLITNNDLIAAMLREVRRLHLKDTSYHASLGGSYCPTCNALKEETR